MNHHHSREIAKFASGLVAADLLCVLWFSSAGLFPVSFLGLTFGSDSILPIALFDILMLVLLIHYGWHIKLPLQSPRERTLLFILGVLMAIVAVAHLSRLAFGLDINIGGLMIPEWLSWIGALVTAYLSYASFHFALHTK